MLIAEHLHKTFRRPFYRRGGADELIRAVEDVSFRVDKGDIFGFLGPNGAGKSTTIRMSLGLIHPSAGKVSIAGFDLATHRMQALRQVGAFVETPAFYNYLTGWENLRIFCGLSGGAPIAELERVIEMVGLKGREHDPVKVYSHGMRQRLGIAACLVPSPQLIVLDEPTDGLDPHGIHEVRRLLKHLCKEEGLTVFLSSHLLGEVENLCNRIVILEKGHAILEGNLDALEREHRRWTLELENAVDAEKVVELLKGKMGLDAIANKDAPGRLSFDLQGKSSVDLHALLQAQDISVRSSAPEQGWLDRLFLERTSSRESWF